MERSESIFHLLLAQPQKQPTPVVPAKQPSISPLTSPREPSLGVKVEDDQSKEQMLKLEESIARELQLLEFRYREKHQKLFQSTTIPPLQMQQQLSNLNLWFCRERAELMAIHKKKKEDLIQQQEQRRKKIETVNIEDFFAKDEIQSNALLQVK
jgi:hypothetical protein